MSSVVDALDSHALAERRNAVTRARNRSRELNSSRRTASVSRRPSAAASWEQTMGSPHGPWDLWTLLGAFRDKDTVFAEMDEGGALRFTCASCEHVFPIKLWPPREQVGSRDRTTVRDGDAAADDAASFAAEDGASSLAHTSVAAHGVPRIGVDGKTPSLVAERLLLASVRHHCASAAHKATLHKLWPELRRRSRPEDVFALDGNGRSRDYVVVTVNGVRTLVSRHVGGSPAFEADAGEIVDDELDAAEAAGGASVTPTAWLHHAATFLSHPYLDCDGRANRVARHRDDGKLSRRNRAWQPCRVRMGHPRAEDEVWNPTSASYVPGAHSAAGRLAVVQHEDGERRTVRTVEMPVARREDTAADFAQVTDGATLRIVRVQPNRSAWRRRVRALTEAAVAAAGGRKGPEEGAEGQAAAAAAHLEGFLQEQARQVLETAQNNHGGLIDSDPDSEEDVG